MRQLQAADGGQTNATLTALVERARKVLLHEQRTGHADVAVKPGGLERFVARWSAELRDIRARGVQSSTDHAPERTPEDALTRLLSGYHQLDPMQRTARVRAALAQLDSIDGRGGHGPRAPAPSRSTATTQARPPNGERNSLADVRPPSAGPRTTGAPTRPPLAMRPPRRTGEADEPWPLASPPPAPPKLATDHKASPPVARPEDEYLLNAPVSAVPGVGKTQEERLARLGIATVRDLLFTFPREHRDYSQLRKIAQLPFDETSTFLGLIWEVENKRTSGGRMRTIARISDETGAIYASWFNQPYLLKQLPRGAHIVLTGVKQRFGNRVEFAVKSHELPEQGDLDQYRTPCAGLSADGGAVSQGDAPVHQVGGGPLRRVRARSLAGRRPFARAPVAVARGHRPDSLSRWS